MKKKIKKDMLATGFVIDETLRGTQKTIVYQKQRFGLVGALACEMVTRWGMVAGEDNGEDTAGRHKIKLSTPKALIKRAYDCAELLYEEARKRGMIIELPAPVRKSRDELFKNLSKRSKAASK